MPFKLQPAGASGKSHQYNGIRYDLLGRIGDIARRAFYPQQAASLKKEEIQTLNSEIERVATKMESINSWIDAAVKRAAKADAKAEAKAK